MNFGQFWDFKAEFGSKKMVLPIFQPYNQVSPKNRPLGIPKKVLSQDLQKLVNEPPSLISLPALLEKSIHFS